jgi:hypothetical protein
MQRALSWHHLATLFSLLKNGEPRYTTTFSFSFFRSVRSDHTDFIATTVGEVSYPESISLVQDNQYAIRVRHFAPNLIFLIGPYRVPVIYENQKCV